MGFQRIHNRELPDGTISQVAPYHISLEGMESTLLCRDEEDYDALQKCFYVSSWANNSIVVADVEMSNHGHLVLLAESLGQAHKVAAAVKKRHSQYLAEKYSEHGLLARSDVKVIYLDSDRYLRNALAYVPRNALDTGQSIDGYKWSSYRAMFSKGLPRGPLRPVSGMTRREKEEVFRTHANLNTVPWLVDGDDCLVPSTACAHKYAEAAFSDDQAFFLRLVGSINCAEMEMLLVTNPRGRKTDSEFRKSAEDISDRWFHTSLYELSQEKKARIIPYLYHCYNTSPAQLARCIGLTREQVQNLLRQ